eukprot:401601-Lingulodinium_polyedra.AAC.1
MAAPRYAALPWRTAHLDASLRRTRAPNARVTERYACRARVQHMARFTLHDFCLNAFAMMFA